MDDFNFNIEGDVLYCNQIKKTDQSNVFCITKVPIITKEVFEQCYTAWILGKKEAKDVSNTTAE